MNITTQQLQAIRAILSKQDKESISEHADKSPRTVEAVLQGNRVNDEIEQLALKQAKVNWAKLGQTIAVIEAKNISAHISIDEFEALRINQPTSGEDYYRYMDVYLDLVHVKFTDMDELWDHIKVHQADIIQKPYWCVSLMSRLKGVTFEYSIAYFNSKF
jgi:hypothetical protein